VKPPSTSRLWPGHERRLAGRKPDGRVGDLFRLATASDGVHGGLRTELRLLAGKAVKHVGVDYRRQNSVDADALFAELQGCRFREADDGMLAGHVDFVWPYQQSSREWSARQELV
jgi:hypothetical protein